MSDSSTFCVLPWIHLATHPNSSVSLCCEANSMLGMSIKDIRDDSLCRLGHESIKEIFNSDSFKEARLAMLSGKKVPACQVCYKKEESGVQSKRQYENENFSLSYEEACEKTAADGSIEPDFKFIELRLGNKCNVKCRTCMPGASSKWVQEYDVLQEKLTFLQKYSINSDYDWPENDKIWEDIQKYSKNLELIYINGGEPLLSKNHWSLIRKFVENGQSKNIKLKYSTNMTLFPKEAKELWPHFKEVFVYASIDDVGERNDYIRHPSKWNVVERVTDEIKQMHDQNVKFIIMQTVCSYNFFYLQDLYDWADERDIYLVHNYVREQGHLRPDAVPLKVRMQALEAMEGTLPDRLYDPLKKMWSEEGRPAQWEQFRTYTKELDVMRKQSFSEVFPEFHESLNSAGFSF